jgi:aspartyl-tRNA(Asn)/glutamyl-tRNA(Gln) amidotransferase subunit C
MTQRAKVSAEDVRYVSDLAYLELGADEAARLQRDLNAILDHIAQLAELDTTTITPMAQVSEVLAGADPSSRNVLRPDIERPSLPRDVVLAAAPESDGVFFKVPKVIER